MSQRPLKALLPTPPQHERDPPHRPPAPSPAFRKRRPLLLAACADCRKRKIKCSGERPRCVTCRDRGVDCKYDTSNEGETRTQAAKRKFDQIEKQNHIFRSVYHALQTRPGPEALEILDRIRQGVDSVGIMQQLNHGDLLLQLSLVPETRYRYDFPYVWEMPSYLRRLDNRYLLSPIYEPSRGPVTEDGSSPTPDTSPELLSPYLRPYHAAEVFDPRLYTIEPSKWTHVTSNDALMRKLLRAYFLQEYQFFTFFHKDYFLDDMMAGIHRFCSPLLVNAVLAYSCYCYRGLSDSAEFWNPQSLAYQFLAEAKRLWESDRGKRRLTTMQAAMVIHAVVAMNGADALGWLLYVKPTLLLAQEIGLFRKSQREMDRTMRAAREHTAWTLFIWQSHISFHSFIRPIIENPPEAPLPDPNKNPQWYGEILLKYPLVQAHYPTNFPSYFKALCEFRIILNDVGLYYFGGAARPKPTFDGAAALYYRLEGWFKSLPESLMPERIVFPSQFRLHAQYHLVILSIFQALVDATTKGHFADGISDGSSSKPSLLGVTAQDVLLQTKLRLETILRVYHLRHGFEYLDFFMIVLLHVVFLLTTGDINEGNTAGQDARRSTLLLCATGAHKQGQSYFLAQTILHILRGMMRKQDLSLLECVANIPSEMSQAVIERATYIQSLWPASTTSITSDPDEHRLEHMLKQYTELSLVDAESDYISEESSPSR